MPATHDAACHARKSHYGCSAMGPSSDGRKGRYGALTVTRRKDATPSVVSGVRGKVFPLASARGAVFGSPLSPRGFTPKTPGAPFLTHPHPIHYRRKSVRWCGRAPTVQPCVVSASLSACRRCSLARLPMLPMVREDSGAALRARCAQSFRGEALRPRCTLRRSALVRSARPERRDPLGSD